MENNSDINTRKEPSHKMDGKYAILMETSEEEQESWYYFIRVEGNEENLKYLANQLNKIDWHLMEESSTFDLDMDYFVSAQTAKDMSKVSLNYFTDHRKFDGKLKKIDFEFRKKDSDETMMCKVFDILGEGKIDEYISDEDVDESDLEDSELSTDNDSISSSSSEEDLKIDRLPSSVLKQKIKDLQDARKKGTLQEKINYDE